MNADQALRLLGRYSRWQVKGYIFICLGFSIPFAWMLMSVVFIGDTPNYRCALPPNGTLNESIPMMQQADGSWTYDKCNMYVNVSLDNSTVPCQYGYWYDPASGYESTLTMEWDLVCGQEWLVELSMTISSVGSMFGAIVFNRLADLYGRKKVFLCCLWSNIVVAMAMACSPHIIFYIVFAFIDGFQQQGCISASFILAVELFPTEQRTFAGNAIEFFWVLGYMSLVLIAYFIRNWRHLLVTITAPLLLTIGFYWGISESVPWLLSNGKTKEAEFVMKKAAKTNKLVLPTPLFNEQPSNATEMELLTQSTSSSIKVTHVSDIELVNSGETSEKPKKQYEYRALSSADDIPEEEVALQSDDKETKTHSFAYVSENGDKNQAQNDVADNYGSGDAEKDCPIIIIVDGDKSPSEIKKYTVLDIMRSKYIRRYTLVFFTAWFVDALAYVSMNYTVTYLPGDRYLNTLLYAVVEIPAYALVWILSDKVGRRLPLVGFHIVGGLALIGTIIQTFEIEADLKWLIICLSMIGKMATTAAFALIYVIVPELYPTNFRNLGLGICQVCARIGTLIAPFARTLQRSIPWLPPLIVGILSTCVGLGSFFLPETRHTQLPDTIEEIEAWQKSKSRLKKTENK